MFIIAIRDSRTGNGPEMRSHQRPQPMQFQEWLLERFLTQVPFQSRAIVSNAARARKPERVSPRAEM